MAHLTGNSLETILTLENRDADSEWSMVWSTTRVAGIDAATGGYHRPRAVGRRRLRAGAFVLGSFLSMHCRVAASALTGGFFVFILLLIPAVVLLANPLRHFEVYLGQWSISGPGRAFRIIPMLDGIGLAICINAIVRSICCGTLAAISGIYVIHGVSDEKLPFTYCRDHDLSPYEPNKSDILILRTIKGSKTPVIDRIEFTPSVTVGTSDYGWRNATNYLRTYKTRKSSGLLVCKETYPGRYPAIYRTPPYNFFYVEVMTLRPDYHFCSFNTKLIWNIIFVWTCFWMVLVAERISYGKLIWNNTYPWFAAIPIAWTMLVLTSGITGFLIKNKLLRKVFKFSTKEVVAGISDALEVALYIHAASTGTELIHGKGLNHYASGHIDPYLNGENVWHSALLLLLTIVNSGSAAVCALADVMHTSLQSFDKVFESKLWIMPMYSKCMSFGNHSHLRTTLLFAGLMFSYMTVAFIFLKTALHTIFEYRVKLVFIEQVVVGGLILICVGLSLLFATNGGLPLLESIDSVMTGLAMPFVCLLELVALLYVYRSSDFVSDVNVATEENMCSTRIGLQWQIIPFLTAVALVLKMIVLSNTELPAKYMLAAIAPLVGVVLAVPLRTCHNAYQFIRLKKRQRK